MPDIIFYWLREVLGRCVVNDFNVGKARASFRLQLDTITLHLFIRQNFESGLVVFVVTKLRGLDAEIV